MYRSPQEIHDPHLRTLLDHRSARADIHGRYSTVSEFSDTPSVYSRPNFSPGSSVNEDRQNIARVDYDYGSPISPSSRFRVEYAHEQQMSMLDLDDDPRSSYAPSGKYNDTNVDDNDGDSTQEGREEEDTASRMSYLGPKMRFHSRAPWEMEDDPLHEEDEAEENTRTFPSGFPFSRGSKNNTSGSSSPRPSYTASRPSGESSTSRILPKRSFETVSSQFSYPKGALYALAQESLSTNSLVRPAATPHKEKLLNKFSLGRLRPEPPEPPLVPSAPLPSFPILQRFPFPARGPVKHTTHSFETPIRSTTILVNKSYNEPSKEFAHPYANPDLVVSYADDQEDEEQSSPIFRTTPDYHPPRNISMTVMEFSSTDSMTKASTKSTSTLTPDTSTSSIMSKHRASAIQSKTISSPVPVISPLQRAEATTSVIHDDHSIKGADFSSLPGWTERNAMPAFSLISLEQARAQRMRSATANIPSRMSTSSGLSNSSTPFPSGENEGTGYPPPLETSNFGNLTSRARGRSISAGATKAKNAVQSLVSQSKSERVDVEDHHGTANVSSAKSLKHKKSGFMRLFNGGKMLEKTSERGEPDSSPPPVPSLPEGITHSSPVFKAHRPPIPRIPVPSVTSTLLDSVGTSVSNKDTSSDESSFGKPSNISSPTRRTPPTLTINTIPPSNSRPSISVVGDRHAQTSNSNTLSRPWLNDQPQSAPANVTEFPTLRLRPVSTLFSAHFGDHIVPDDSRSSAETTDLDTPRSPSPTTALMSPMTPGSSTRAVNDKSLISVQILEDKATIKTLRDELASSRKVWQRQLWELEGQVRDLKAELDQSRTKFGDEYCQSCGRGAKKPTSASTAGDSVLNRPRARTGTSSRFVSAHP